MIIRRVQLAIVSALKEHRINNFSPIQEALAHMQPDGTYPDGWSPTLDPTGPTRIYSEKPIDNLKKYPFICTHVDYEPKANHTQDVTVYDVNGENPESYPGITCWSGQWHVYAEDNGDAPFRAERIREMIDNAMEHYISGNRLDFSLPEESMDPIPSQFLPIPPRLELINFRRIGLTQAYDEWYDGRRYWWRGLRYEVELQEANPTHSSLR